MENHNIQKNNKEYSYDFKLEHKFIRRMHE